MADKKEFVDPLADIGDFSGEKTFSDPLDNWKPEPTFNERYEARAEKMTPQELSVARSKNNEFGEYLREAARRRQPGETDQAYAKRLYGYTGPEHIPEGEGMLRAGFQGSSYGFGDEVVAGAAAAADSMAGRGPYSKAYDARLEREREKIGLYADQSPWLSGGAEFAGALTNPATYVGTGARTGMMAGDMALQGVIAGVQGAVHGFGRGEGGFANRAAEAAFTGGLSAPLGAAAPVVGAGVGRLAAGRVDPAMDILASNARDQNFVRDGTRRIMSAGRRSMVTDADPAYDQILNTAVARSGPAGSVARQAIESRASSAADDFTRALDDVLGQPTGIRQRAMDISRSTSSARRSAYDEFHATPIDYASEAGRGIERALGRIPPQLMRQAIEKANIRLAGMENPPRQIMAELAEDGSVAFREMPNTVQLDAIKRGLDGLATGSRDIHGRPGDLTDVYEGFAKGLREAVSDAVPAYRQALKEGADKIALDNALELGANVFKMDREAVDLAARKLTPETREMAANGIRRAIDDAMAKTKMALGDQNMDVREAVKGLKELSSRASVEKMVSILGQRDANRLSNVISETARAMELRAAVSRNSDTFTRTSVDEMVKGRSREGVTNALRQGRGINAGQELVKQLLGGTETAVKDADDRLYARLVELLTGSRGAQAAQVLQQIGATPRQVATSQEARRLAAALTRGASSSGAPLVLDRFITR